MASTTPKLRACDRCASIKQVCDRDGKASCSRCTRLELPCAIARVHKPMGRPRKALQISNHLHVSPPIAATAAADLPSPESPQSDVDRCACGPSPLSENRGVFRIKRVQRTRSGCITCKQRRKKCDETFPVCGDCNRLGLPCQRPPHQSSPTAAAVAARGRSGSSVSSASSSSSSSSSSSYSCTSLAPRNPDRAASFEVNYPNYPQTPHPHVPHHYSRQAPSPEYTLRLYDGCTPQEQHLLQHYTHVVARSLSVVPDEINSFISIFVPMALQQPAMRNALLALSAIHLKRHHKSFEYIAVEYQNLAVQQANQLLTQHGTDNNATTEGLATILFMCLQEVCEGKSQKWPMHLHAATTIINSRGGPGAYPDSVKFLIETVAYFDSIATLSSSNPSFLDQQFYIPPNPATPIPAHPLFGTSHALFAIIADISRLAELAPNYYSSPTTNSGFLAMAADLELQLQSWYPVPCSSQTSDPELDGKVAAAGIMLQWAALLRLHLVASGGDMKHPKVRVAVRNILDAMDTIPEGDLVESMLIFPMFAAGFGAEGEDERRRVDRRFAVMERSIGFGNVFDAREAVRRHWDKEDRGCWDGGWEGVMGGVHGTLIMS